MARRSSFALQLGRRIVQLRTERGLTQEALAWAADLKSKGYLSRIESGERLPSLDVLCRLARRLEVEPRDLLTFPEQDAVATAIDLMRNAPAETVRRVTYALEVDAKAQMRAGVLRAAERGARGPRR